MIARDKRDQGRQFDEFRLEDRVSNGHLQRRINVFVAAELTDLHKTFEHYHGDTSRPSVDPELMVRLLIFGYCHGIRSEHRLSDEVAMILAYR